MPPTPYPRSPLAKARDEWLESREGTWCLEYWDKYSLKQRLESAFLAGASWGKLEGLRRAAEICWEAEAKANGGRGSLEMRNLARSIEAEASKLEPTTKGKAR